MSSRKAPAQQEIDEEYLRSLMARQCVYIDRRLHRKITTLVGVAGTRRFTVGNFIDNVLEQHFERHRTEIRSLCSKGLNKIL